LSCNLLKPRYIVVFTPKTGRFINKVAHLLTKWAYLAAFPCVAWVYA